MNWKNAAEFFAMGGYGTYVWGAYATTAVLMGLEAWLALRRRRRAMAAAVATVSASTSAPQRRELQR